MASGYFHNRLKQLETLISGYTYPESLALYLNRYFKENKQLGSRDRRQVKHWFYLYFKSDIVSDKLEEELLQLLASDQSVELEKLRSELPDIKYNPPQKRGFPLSNFLSSRLSEEQKENLKSEKLFWVRTHKRPQEEIVDSFENVIYGLKQGSSMAESNLIQIQDRSSYEGCKKTVDLLADSQIKLWDCCSGAGGKSLAVMDLAKAAEKSISLFTSDIRPQMAKSIAKRMKAAGHSILNHSIIDLTKSTSKIKFGNEEVGLTYFDAILVDAPCSGSGTWGRNAQHLRCFKEDKLSEYIQLQQSLVKNVLPFLKENGRLFYLTCSTYAAENEEQIKYFEANFDLKLEEDSYLGNKFSDVLYWSCLTKKNS